MRFRNLRIFLAAFAALAALSLTTIAQDAAVSGVLHDSRVDVYRSPSGAVPFGTTVTLRLRALDGKLDGATVRLYSTFSQTETTQPMNRVAATADGYELWETSLNAGTDTTVWYYRFIVNKDGRVWYYEDDTIAADGNYITANKGGSGKPLETSVDASYQIGVYDPSMYTPEWMRNAVVYQIFPDRFRDGDPANNPAPGSDVFYGDLPLLFNSPWNSNPVDGRTTQAPSGAGYYNADFSGGDLDGITTKLDYLQDLGVTAIYLNPIFAARSNHRYDTEDYTRIDPILGTMDDFRDLIAAMNERGMHLILDGVFNHMSSDSAYFDRYHRFEGDLGACESADSDYRNWFYFRAPTGTQPTVCADSGAGDTFYESWFGFDSIPKINNTIFATRAYFFRGQTSVARTWGAEGIGGWRFDVGGDIDNGRDPENSYWEDFRKVARIVNPETVMIGEEWNDATEWLLGDEWDSVMNYRFRRAIIGFVRGTNFADNDGAIPGLTPVEFINTVQSVAEDYPPLAYDALMNLLGSHDTSRLYYTLDNDAQSVKLAASTLFSLPGAPTIYYGDEIALDAPNIGGQDDPYNRAPYPWTDTEGDAYPAPNDDVLAHYKLLGQLRHANSALREGRMIPYTSDAATASFFRLDPVSANAAFVVINTSAADVAYPLTPEFAGGTLPVGLTLTDALGTNQTVTIGTAATLNVPARSALILVGTGDPAAFTLPLQAQPVTATADSASVTLTWPSVPDATGFYVYRSSVPSGGFERLTAEPVSDLEYVDSLLTPGFVYYYAISSVNAAGVEGTLTAATEGVVPYDIASAVFTTVPSGEFELGYGFVQTAWVEVKLAGSDQPAAPRGLIVEAAILPAGADLADADWKPMSTAFSATGTDYAAPLAPNVPGTYTIVARVSGDAGRTFIPVLLPDNTLPGFILSANPDTVAPDAPANLKVVSAGASGVSLGWDAAAAEDLAAYRVTRSVNGAAPVVVAEIPAGTNAFDDSTVALGSTYKYTVSALDFGLNESAQIATGEIDVTRSRFNVRFIVTAPPSTPADATVYIAGDFKSGDTYPSWDPGAVAMLLENLGDNKFAITLPLDESLSIDYKFARGTWDAVEKGPECEEISNRKLTTGLDTLGAPDADGLYIVEVEVAKWRDTDQCG